MRQRGRKSRLQRQTLALVANASAPSHNPPQPCYRLDEPEKRMWDAITAAYPDLTYGGKLLLCFGLKSLERGRYCSEVIAREGQTIPRRKKGIPKAHPLLSVEHRSRQFCQTVFKKLKIELRGGEF